ncbi:hypothetical protein DRP44_08515 [candidate division TA06 bacterium]|uniref:6-bladed beta-propeller n=1 Tax=candidate division TA06 bacterium TaxID=2250710 RepID=A0A660S472_UNCT6|nr:MAG: hypothetical protein DRP44_08515 [candidate division TA06 bacterium]
MEVSVNKRLMLTILFLSFSVSLFSQVNPDTLPEKYVKKVIIDAKWGNGLGEFGINLNSDPITAPGGISIDKNGDIYIVDMANHRIQHFDRNGKLSNIFKISAYPHIFGVINGIIYCGSAITDTLMIINSRLNTRIFTKIDIPVERNSVISGLVENGKLVILQPILQNNSVEERKWILSKINGSTAEFVKSRQRLSKSSKHDYDVEIKNIGRIKIKEGSKAYAVDKKGNNYYTEYISQGAQRFFIIIKVSKKGKILSIIELRKENTITSDGMVQNPVITSSGDIYYLYPTGELKIENWKKKFIPGKVQVIKWELQK